MRFGSLPSRRWCSRTASFQRPGICAYNPARSSRRPWWSGSSSSARAWYSAARATSSSRRRAFSPSSCSSAQRAASVPGRLSSRPTCRLHPASRPCQSSAACRRRPIAPMLSASVASSSRTFSNSASAFSSSPAWSCHVIARKKCHVALFLASGSVAGSHAAIASGLSPPTGMEQLPAGGWIDREGLRGEDGLAERRPSAQLSPAPAWRCAPPRGAAHEPPSGYQARVVLPLRTARPGPRATGVDRINRQRLLRGSAPASRPAAASDIRAYTSARASLEIRVSNWNNSARSCFRAPSRSPSRKAVSARSRAASNSPPAVVEPAGMGRTVPPTGSAAQGGVRGVQGVATGNSVAAS